MPIRSCNEKGVGLTKFYLGEENLPIVLQDLCGLDTNTYEGLELSVIEYRIMPSLLYKLVSRMSLPR